MKVRDMKKMEEIRQMSVEALLSDVLDFKRASLNLRFQKVSGELKGTHQFRENRRQVARLKTVLSMRFRTGKKKG